MPGIDETEFGLWPTPKAGLGEESRRPAKAIIKAIAEGKTYRANGTMPEICLARRLWADIWPEYPRDGIVNPEFVENLMGFPMGWTDLNV
jgi:hypothetical protein